jgi:hypothetical protein
MDAKEKEPIMRKFAIVLSALVATLFVSNAASAQSVDIRIGNGGFGIGVYSGHRGHGDWGRGGWDRGGWDRRGPVYRQPAPIYRDPCDFRDCVPSTITVRVHETCVDRYGNVGYTGRVILRTAWYDSYYGGYIYRDDFGRIVRVR